jgi:predicted phosphohydrolase
MTTTFQIVSDLHIEYKNNQIHNPLDYITPCADILILAGDIGSLYKINQLNTFLESVCKLFKIVIYVIGNQEYYMMEDYKPVRIQVLKNRLLEIENNISNLHVLDRSSIIINNICITGATLWSKPLIKIPRFLVRIFGINTEIYETEHKNDLEYIQMMCEYARDNNLQHLVVTHYCPTSRVLSGIKRRDKFSSLYTTDLDEMLSIDNVHTWVCGHVHSNFDFVTDEGTRVVGNQKGKEKDKITDFQKDFVISVDEKRINSNIVKQLCKEFTMEFTYEQIDFRTEFRTETSAI